VNLEIQYVPSPGDEDDPPTQATFREAEADHQFFVEKGNSTNFAAVEQALVKYRTGFFTDPAFGKLLNELEALGLTYQTTIPCRSGLLASKHAYIAHFRLSETKLLSGDENPEALFIPCLHLEENVIRAVVSGKSLAAQLRGFSWRGKQWSMVWGDFTLYETGRPDLVNFIALVGNHEVIDPARVMRAVKHFKSDPLWVSTKPR
jgi:hypothetical protein